LSVVYDGFDNDAAAADADGSDNDVCDE